MEIHIGMRKIKSLIALVVSFVIWQIVKVFFPMLEMHPVFAYIYSVIELRETADRTRKFGKLRIKATFIGLVVGLLVITLSIFVSSKIGNEICRLLVEFLFVLAATLISLIVAENAKCENYCGIAAIISIICMVSINEDDVYLYAIMRVVQTLIGVFSAMFINVIIPKKEKLNKKEGINPKKSG